MRAASAEPPSIRKGASALGRRYRATEFSRLVFRMPASPGLGRRDLAIAGPALAIAAMVGAFVAAAPASVVGLGGATVALALVALASAGSPRTAVALVFAASTLSGLTLPTPIGVLRTDQAIVVPALCGVLARMAVDRGDPPQVMTRAPLLLTVCLGLYVLANFASTVLMALDVASSIRIALWLSLSFAAYLLTIAAAGRFGSVASIVDAIVAIGAVASGVAVVLYLLAGLGLTTFGVQSDPVSGQISAKGTLYEANLLGSYAAVTALLAASQLVHAHHQTRRRGALLLLATTICVAAAYVSFTRAAWLGLAAGALVLLVVSRPPLGRVRAVAWGGLLVAAAGPFLLVSGAGSQLVDRLLSLVTDSTGSIAFRSANMTLALTGIPDHLWLGAGTNSFGQHFQDPTQGYGPAYIGGLLIATLWDVGVWGLGLLLIAFATLTMRVWRGFGSIDYAIRSLSAGFAAAFTCALVAYQATNGFWFAYTWILMGLAASVQVRLPFSSGHLGSLAGNRRRATAGDDR